MEFKQTRFQYMFAKIYEQVCVLIWELVFTLVLGVFAFEKDIFWFLVIFLSASVGYFLWMLYGPNEEGDQSLYLGEDVFRFKKRNVVTEFDWTDYQGFQITKTIPYRVKVKSKTYGSTSFSFYAFSAEQRRRIFTFLNNKSPIDKDSSI